MAISSGAEGLAKGIIWCGVMTVERLHWGNEVLRKRIQPGDTDAEVTPEMLKRIKRAKKVTKMSEKVATGILSGVVKVTGHFTSSIANSKAGKKFFSLLPGEIVPRCCSPEPSDDAHLPIPCCMTAIHISIRYSAALLTVILIEFFIEI
ncbi:hypothetical protein QYE76_018735 [Lolium multiflorum]|uniref:Senescence domain-containing protein n=1 Tax=Lolium multiflorum TaxID=4521 RepID=A0AAD8QK12_LOLMU|nr:hypothetical protein QYE76_018735 [Lolium multiflorum]